MTRGKRWTIQEETELKTLIQTNTPLLDIAVQLQKTPGAVIIKAQRLGLKLPTKDYMPASVSMPKELPSVEETLKMLAGALKTAITPGLGKVEVSRLQAVATISKAYKEILADYVNYRQIEAKLKEMEKDDAKLRK
jgi:hypothetical protein